MVLMDMARLFLISLLAFFVLTTLVHSQVDQAGFISIDCGVSANYTDGSTGLNYVSDEIFRETGVVGTILAAYKIINLSKQLTTVRSFPDGRKNCYSLRPSLAISTKYLIRARFMYGNYDGKNNLPNFDVYLDSNLWGRVEFVEANTSISLEIIANITRTYTYVCLANTGQGTPVISALELRPIKSSDYAPTYGALKLFKRFNFGSTPNQVIRYKDDANDRRWLPYDWPGMDYINTTLTIDADTIRENNPPSVVMSTAVTPRNNNDSICLSWDIRNTTTEFYPYLYVAEVQQLAAGEIREFTFKLNGKLQLNDPLKPQYLRSTTVSSSLPKGSDLLLLELVPTNESTLPPLLNAVEVYMVLLLSQAPTSQDEVTAMKSIKSLYGVTRNWQGDPCAPQMYMWEGLNCSFTDYDPPIITTLNLSSSGLTGKIPSYIGDLKSLQILDLSNNTLTGSVPEFLTQLPSLTFLNLSKNNLSGPIPSGLTEKRRNKSLTISVDENVDDKKKKKKSILRIVAPIVVVVVVIVVVVCCYLKKKKKNEGQGQQSSGEEASMLKVQQKQQISYAEVQRMTNNFAKIVGKGGFGTVYLGNFNGAQVAVKLLSPSSVQGYKEFCAEVKILMKVHHKNLTSLVAYCDDKKNKALVYEYMVQGNLDDHLSKNSRNVSSWEKRLRIALDCAQGLQYMHSGCKPPILHRDVKTTNILLDDSFQAKIADFGLSRGIPTESGAQKTTDVAGTIGYLDPEYHETHRLMEKSDVYSFGVVILEMITGRPVISRDHETPHISDWTRGILENEGEIREIVDSRLESDFDDISAYKAVKLAVSCVSRTSTSRPTMTEVMVELKECLDMEVSRRNMNNHATIPSFSIDMTASNR